MAKPCGANFWKDRQDWDYIKCGCGWKSPPMPDLETAADAYGDHRAAKAVTVAARAIRQALVKIDPTYFDEAGGALATEIPRATEPCPLLVRVADDRCATCGWEAETHRAEALQSDSAEVTPDPPSSDDRGTHTTEDD